MLQDWVLSAETQVIFLQQVIPIDIVQRTMAMGIPTLVLNSLAVPMVRNLNLYLDFGYCILDVIDMP